MTPLLYIILGLLSKPSNSVASSLEVKIAGTIKSENWGAKGFGTVAANGSAIISSSPSNIVKAEASYTLLPYKYPPTDFLYRLKA